MTKSGRMGKKKETNKNFACSFCTPTTHRRSTFAIMKVIKNGCCFLEFRFSETLTCEINRQQLCQSINIDFYYVQNNHFISVPETRRDQYLLPTPLHFKGVEYWLLFLLSPCLNSYYSAQSTMP